MRLFAVYSVLGGMVADEVHHAMRFACVRDAYHVRC